MYWQLYLTFVLLRLTVAGSRTLKIGFFSSYNDSTLIEFIGWRRSAAAISLAWDKINAEGLLPGYEAIKIFSRFDDCKADNSAGMSIELIIDDQVDVIIGPPCSDSAMVVGTTSTYYDFPLFLWGPPVSSQLADLDRFPTVVVLNQATISQPRVVCKLLQQMGWSEFALIYRIQRIGRIPRCEYIVNDLTVTFKFSVTVLNDYSELTMTYRRSLSDATDASLQDVFAGVKRAARIVIVCLEDMNDRRNYMIGAAENEADTDEYLHVDWPTQSKRRQGRPGVAWSTKNLRVVLTKEEKSHLRKLRQFDHDSLNRFIGLTMDGPEIFSVWRYCSRRSLKGLFALHHSQFGAHGYLSSNTCLVDERWQVKLTFYGLDFIKEKESRAYHKLLWTAPELIREAARTGTMPGDIYSFAIVASEIITQKSPWDLNNIAEDPDELIYKIKRGGIWPIRPSLETKDPQHSDINASMVHLIKDCWDEDERKRPTIDAVRSMLKAMNTGRSANLMDHIFNVMEQYAANLEEEVQERTKELFEEKKKSDVILYRMLPKMVADKLKLAQSVEPESFESVTIFFSDVVSFTKLAAKCTPLQVVNLLNDLYTAFDAIIDEHKVYKVETIGDGYLCVSGLPYRNGFLRAIAGFRIAHLSQERISIRIGIHTGPCVAGVVGVTMPRYCLFSDTVNTASRMESNGKPGQIHISFETNRYLTQIIGGYNTVSRGEVIIKGKGVMETYWLLSGDQSLDDNGFLYT